MYGGRGDKQISGEGGGKTVVRLAGKHKVLYVPTGCFAIWREGRRKINVCKESWAHQEDGQGDGF